MFERAGELWCDASIHVPCRHLRADADGCTAQCAAHGFAGKVPSTSRTPAPRQLGGDRFLVADKKRLTIRRLPPAAPPKRALPLAPVANPCATAPCQTSDHKQGSACCRDIQVDICCTRKQTHLEALIRNRKSPYLCKAERENDDQLLVEVISACGFLEGEGECALHGRTRADGRPAKPIMCSRWPEKRSGLHVGCAFRNRRLKV